MVEIKEPLYQVGALYITQGESLLKITDIATEKLSKNDGDLEMYYKYSCVWLDNEFGEKPYVYTNWTASERYLRDELGLEPYVESHSIETEQSVEQGSDPLRGTAINPNHYNGSAIQPLYLMFRNFNKDEYIGFLKGNILKYNLRYADKNGLEDLRKAQFYQDRLVEYYDKGQLTLDGKIHTLIPLESEDE